MTYGILRVIRKITLNSQIGSLFDKSKFLLPPSHLRKLM